MKKGFGFLFVLIVCMLSTNAQKSDVLNLEKDNFLFEGYLIRVLPINGNGYGYDIFERGQLVIHQLYNPFTLSQNGLTKKEDVYKIAKWQISQLHGRKNMPIKINEKISKNVAQKLGITIDEK